MDASRRRRVTLIGSLPPHKGISPYVRDLASELAARDDVDLEVLSFRNLYPRRLYPGGDPETPERVRTDVTGARVRRDLRWWNPFGWLWAALTMRGGVVHAQWWSFFLAPCYVVLLAIGRARGKRIILTVHNVEPHEGGVPRRIANRVVLPFAHTIVVHTEENRATLIERGHPAERVAVVPMGIGAGRPVMAASETRRTLGVPDGAPLVLFAGNIRPYKGVADLIDAFPAVLDAVPDTRLVVAGQPWGDPRELRQRIHALGIAGHVVTRLEFVPDAEMDAMLAAADVVVYPYRYFDAQSAAACEALRFGRAIIVSSTGGLPDLVDDPLAVVPPGSPSELARAIIRVLTDSDLRARLEATSARKAQESSWPSVAAATADLYRGAA